MFFPYLKKQAGGAMGTVQFLLDVTECVSVCDSGTDVQVGFSPCEELNSRDSKQDAAVTQDG